MRFSRLLRRSSDPRTATLTAPKRGGRTLILDIIPRDDTGRGYQSLSEVRLALRTKADMLVPGETVNVYGGSGGKSELLISSAQRGRAFLGTVESQSALKPRLLDEKVSGAILVDWAAWAASTTFPSTDKGLGYETREVDAFRSAVRDTFLGGAVFWVSTPSVRSDDVRGKQFSTQRRGYDKTEVDAFVEAAGLRLAAMESTDRPAGALVSGAVLFGWAEWVELTGFSPGDYMAMEVDTFKEAIRDTFLGVRKFTVKSVEVRGKRFSSSDDTHPGYDMAQVAAFLDAAGIRLAAMESTDRPAGPLISGAILAEWAEWVDSTRFSTAHRLREGYATVEVDAFRKELRDTFLGVRQPALTWDDVDRKWPGSGMHQWFSTTRGWSRLGYDMQEVDAFLKMAKLRLAAMIDRPAAPPVSGTMLTERAVKMDFNPWEYRPDAGFAEGIDLINYAVVAADGVIGRVEAYYNSNPAYLEVVEVVDVTSFFGRALTLPAGLVERIDSTKKKVYVDRTRDQIKDAPRYDNHALADRVNYRKSLGSYYSGTYMPPGDQM